VCLRFDGLGIWLFGVLVVWWVVSWGWWPLVAGVFVAWAIRCVFWEWFCVVVVTMLFCIVVWCGVSLLSRLCVVGTWIWQIIVFCLGVFCDFVSRYTIVFCFPYVLLLLGDVG